MTGARKGPRVWVAAAALAASALCSFPAHAVDEPDADFSSRLDEAVAAARAGDRDHALELLYEIDAEYPDRPVVQYDLALVFEFDEDGNRYENVNLNIAAAFYREALALEPSFAPARFNLGVVWQKLGYLDEAAAEYRLAAHSPGAIASRAQYNLALVLKEQGRYEEAVAALKQNDPYDDAARVRLLALLAEDLGEVGRAIGLWKRALEMDDSPTPTALGVKHLQALRGY
jgi:tetratricopeptide (TPR) repeat protein